VMGEGCSFRRFAGRFANLFNLEYWCPGPGSNRHGPLSPRDFKSLVSTNFSRDGAILLEPPSYGKGLAKKICQDNWGGLCAYSQELCVFWGLMASATDASFWRSSRS